MIWYILDWKQYKDHTFNVWPHPLFYLWVRKVSLQTGRLIFEHLCNYCTVKSKVPPAIDISRGASSDVFLCHHSVPGLFITFKRDTCECLARLISIITLSLVQCIWCDGWASETREEQQQEVASLFARLTGHVESLWPNRVHVLFVSLVSSSLTGSIDDAHSTNPDLWC